MSTASRPAPTFAQSVDELRAVLAAAHSLSPAVERAGAPRAAFVSQVPLAALMVAYTLFGLWLLAAPAAG